MSSINASINPMYAVPLMHCLIPGHESLNVELVKLFFALEGEGDRHRDREPRDTQVGIFESNFYLHKRTEACVSILFGNIKQAIFSLVQGINAYSDSQMANIRFEMHSWFHITRNGGFQSSHRHPNASWSAIYCVDPGDSDDPQSGIVRFHDPKSDSMMYMDPAIANLQMPYRLGAFQLTHKPGQLIVFPSYLVHEVFPYTGRRPRIVVALNSWAQWLKLPA
ncbi:putative 2OG-Fe(II) oxygenase [Luteimonas saliphila]|uniref:putative 2OG-Fe(II) oxygenase n=1 Tax=Luteimonas saliphila TaxID=2804919 RepID=UPI00192DCB0A|nr:putative 2OG-Fe(II) oxygenase [Luteimonas saliphila]